MLSDMSDSSCQRILGGGGAAAARRAFLAKACAVAAAERPGLAIMADEARFALSVEQPAGRLSVPLAELYEDGRALPAEERGAALREGLRALLP
jgi:hypothetical protein